ncbi:MAG: hypothetical protein SFV32_06065 [Opitutaceae bacterium]|nr:hypothetical protein [Opitutaceae bacterium]
MPGRTRVGGVQVWIAPLLLVLLSTLSVFAYLSSASRLHAISRLTTVSPAQAIVPVTAPEAMELAALGGLDLSTRVLESENFPHGRNISESGPLRFWLRGLANANLSLFGLSSSDALRASATWSDLLLLAFAAGFGVTLTWATCGRASAVAFLACLTLPFPLCRAFSPGLLDSGAGAIVFLSVSIASLAAMQSTHRRVWAVCSGAALAIAFWWDPLISLAGVGIFLLGATVLLLFFRDATRSLRDSATWFLVSFTGTALAAVAIDPSGFGRLSGGLVPDGLADLRLGKTVRSALAPDFVSLIYSADGARQGLLALLPLIALAFALFWCWRRRSQLSPVFWCLVVSAAASAVHAFFCLRLWSGAQLWAGGALAMLAGAYTAEKGLAKWMSMAVVTGVGAASWLFGIGLSQPIPWSFATQLTREEARAVVLQDLALWLNRRTEGEKAAILAPPLCSTTLRYHGAGNVVASMSLQNEAGIRAATTAFLASSFSSAAQPVFDRGITHVILPAWDTYFEERAAEAGLTPDEHVLSFLRNLRLPPWLRALPYQAPEISGMEQEPLLVLQVVEAQSELLAYTRIIDTFLELGDRQNALAVARELRRFPGELAASVARAHVSWETGDANGAKLAVEEIVGRVKQGADRDLLLDRRVSLAIALARGKRLDLAKVQAERIANELDPETLGMLTDGAVINFMKLLGLVGIKIENPRVIALVEKRSAK